MITAALVLLLQLGRIMATGSAPIEEGDRARARQEALCGALEQAVEQAASAEGASYQAFKSPAASLKSRLDRLRRFVPTYRVLREQELPNSTFELAIEAQVDMPLLRKSMAGTTAPPAGTPAGTAGTSNSGKAKPGAIVKRVLLAAPKGVLERLVSLVSGQVEIVESVETGPRPGPVTKPVKKGAKPPAERPAEVSVDAKVAIPELLTLSKSRGGSGVLWAEVVQLPQGPVRGTPVVATEVQVKVSWYGDSGAVLATGVGRKQVFLQKDEADDVTAARTPEALILLPDAVKSVLAAVDRQNSLKPVRLFVVGLSGMGQAETLMHLLLGLPGVVSVEPRRFGDGLVQLDVRGRVGASQFAESLKKVSGIEVQGLSDDDIRVRVDNLPSNVRPEARPATSQNAPAQADPERARQTAPATMGASP